MIRQLSVFVENQPGSIMRVISELADAKINIRAVASYDTPEFGILRMVVDKPQEAKEHLTSRGFVVRIQEVIGAELKDEKGSLNKMLQALADKGISISYIYSFVIRDRKEPVMVFNTDDKEKAEQALLESGVRLVGEEEL